MQQMCGISMFATETGSVIAQYDQNVATYVPLTANIVQLLATLLYLPIMNRFGRKKIIFLGYLALGVCDLLIGVAFLVTYLIGWTSGVFVSLAFIYLFVFVYGATIGSIIGLYVP